MLAKSAPAPPKSGVIAHKTKNEHPLSVYKVSDMNVPIEPREIEVLKNQQTIRWQEMMYRRDYEEKTTRWTVIFLLGATAWLLTNPSFLQAPYGKLYVLFFLLLLTAGAILMLKENHKSYQKNLEILTRVDESLGLISDEGTPILWPKEEAPTPPKWGVYSRGIAIIMIWIACSLLVITSDPNSPTASGNTQNKVTSVEIANSSHSFLGMAYDPNTWVAVVTLLLVIIAVWNLREFKKSVKDSKIPVVVFRYRWESKPNGEQVLSYRMVNAGSGPALNLNLSWKNLNERNEIEVIPVPTDDALPPESGNPDLQIAFAFGPTEVVLLKDPNISLIAGYEDIWGRPYRTIFQNCRHSFQHPSDLTDTTSNEKRSSSPKKGQIWKIVVCILAFVPLIGLILNDAYHREQVQQYKEQLSPQMECYYRYFTQDERHVLILKNTGLIDCKDVWAEERIFLIINDIVYDGVDVPHLDHFFYNGSRTSMWPNISKGQEVEVNIADMQIEAFHELREQFAPIVISQWRMIYSKESSSERYITEKSFIFDFSDRKFTPIQEYVGGVSYQSKIKDYLSAGTQRRIGIFELTGEFTIDPPTSFLIKRDYSFVPLYPDTRLGLDDLDDILLFHAGKFEIQPSDDVSRGSARYTWKNVNGRWEKEILLVGRAQVISRPFRLLPAYFSPKDLAKIKVDSKSQETFTSRMNSGENITKDQYQEIIAKAEKKYASVRD